MTGRRTAAEVVEQTLYDLGYTGSLSSDARTVLDRLVAAGHMSPLVAEGQAGATSETR